ncbi:CRISPR-associated endoribonuclease Cas6 [Eisenibacter elegans]|uniref:CRISPR-associated endoribonuclease Cas6 n=1 Tax=Eisenibacter elegans TaxID=997 RepID=UPI00040837DD|nr:CRISPR-associated endoribonuclease Cas6 [Eisenibacter elegans]
MNRGAYVPFHHQHLLADLIQELTQTEDRRYEHFEDYNFSGLKGQTKVSKAGLHFYSSRVTLVLASSSESFIRAFLQRLFSFPKIKIGALQLTPEFTEREHLPELGEENKYVCISPTVLAPAHTESGEQDPAKRFILPNTDEFSDILYDTTMIRMENSGMFTSEQMASFFRFQLVPDAQYLQKAKRSDKKFARIYTVYDQALGYEVRGYTFPFVLHAAPEVQQFVFIRGLGAYTHKGFGMIDIANADPVARTEPYHWQ